MANTVYEVVDIQLSNGQDISIKPLTIKNLKKFTEVVKKLDDANITTEEQAMEIFIEAGMVCMAQFSPELSQDKELFEDIIEVPTLMKILEVAGGLKMNDPNPVTATDLLGMN
jgi:hypothetical protein